MIARSNGKAKTNSATKPPQAATKTKAGKQARPARLARGIVWEARTREGTFAGYVVTDRDDYNVLIAYCPSFETQHAPDNNELREQWNTEALAQAQAIAQDFKAANNNPRAIDLRPMGGLDSERPMLADAYSWRLHPPGHHDVMPIIPVPFCRFRLGEMLKAFIAKRFTDDDCEKFHYRVNIGIEDAMEESLFVGVKLDPRTTDRQLARSLSPLHQP